jgi:hypothetical protein
MRLPSACLLSSGIILFGVGSLEAQTVWQPLVTVGQTRIWADSTSWARIADNTWAVRLRTIEGRVDGKPSTEASVHRMEFDCGLRTYRVRQTSVERGGRIIGVPLPDSLGSSNWASPQNEWLEDYMLRAVCERAAKQMPSGSDT